MRKPQFIVFVIAINSLAQDYKINLVDGKTVYDFHLL